MTVAKVTILIGILLSLLGIGFYVGLMVVDDSAPSVTALIPAFAGIPILLLGLVALNESWRKHAMHVVSMFALIGFVLPVGRLGMQLAKGADVKPTVLTSLILMGLLSGILLVACIRSFVMARRRAAAAE